MAKIMFMSAKKLGEKQNQIKQEELHHMLINEVRFVVHK
jgi:hypothetical protein